MTLSMTAGCGIILIGCQTVTLSADLYYLQEMLRRRVGMADEADSKSVVGNHVRVQVPPPALLKERLQGYIIL